MTDDYNSSGSDQGGEGQGAGGGDARREVGTSQPEHESGTSSDPCLTKPVTDRDALMSKVVCENHDPGEGAYAGCMVCENRDLTLALQAIDELTDRPSFGGDCNEEGVVERIKAKLGACTDYPRIDISRAIGLARSVVVLAKNGTDLHSAAVELRDLLSDAGAQRSETTRDRENQRLVDAYNKGRSSVCQCLNHACDMTCIEPTVTGTIPACNDEQCPSWETSHAHSPVESRIPFGTAISDSVLGSDGLHHVMVMTGSLRSPVDARVAELSEALLVMEERLVRMRLAALRYYQSSQSHDAEGVLAGNELSTLLGLTPK